MHRCHGDDARGKKIVEFKQEHEKKIYNCSLVAPDIKDIDYQTFSVKVNSKKNPNLKFEKEEVCDKLIYYANVMPTYFLVEEEIDAMMSSIWDWFSDMMPETAKWIEEKVAAFKGLFSSENLQNLTQPTANTSNPAETEGANGANDDVTRESYAAEMEQKRLDKKIKEKFKDDPNIALKLQESKTIDILKQTQDTTSLAFQQNTEQQEKLLKNIMDHQDRNSKVFKETLEKSSMARLS